MRNPGGKISANYAAIFFTCENLTMFLTVARQELLTGFRHLKSFSRNRPDRFFGVFRSGSQPANHSLSLQRPIRRQLSTLPCRFSTFQGQLSTFCRIAARFPAKGAFPTAIPPHPTHLHRNSSASVKHSAAAPSSSQASFRNHRLKSLTAVSAEYGLSSLNIRRQIAAYRRRAGSAGIVVLSATRILPEAIKKREAIRTSIPVKTNKSECRFEFIDTTEHVRKT